MSIEIELVGFIANASENGGLNRASPIRARPRLLDNIIAGVLHHRGPRQSAAALG